MTRTVDLLLECFSLLRYEALSPDQRWRFLTMADAMSPAEAFDRLGAPVQCGVC